MSEPRINCRMCDAGFSPFSKECPHCGNPNHDFFRVPKGKRAQVHKDLWIDREVDLAMVKLQISLGMSLNQVYAQAAEEFITKHQKKAG